MRGNCDFIQTIKEQEQTYALCLSVGKSPHKMKGQTNVRCIRKRASGLHIIPRKIGQCCPVFPKFNSICFTLSFARHLCHFPGRDILPYIGRHKGRLSQQLRSFKINPSNYC